MSEERRFFLAHAKGDDDQRIASLVEQARAAIERFAKGKPYAITTGRDFFETAFKRCGSWAAWAAEIATGVEFTARAPLFHAIMVPAGRVGAGTAAIVERALAASKPVFVFYGHLSARVVRVMCESQKDWQHGYKLIADRQLD